MGTITAFLSRAEVRAPSPSASERDTLASRRRVKLSRPAVDRRGGLAGPAECVVQKDKLVLGGLWMFAVPPFKVRQQGETRRSSVSSAQGCHVLCRLWSRAPAHGIKRYRGRKGGRSHVSVKGIFPAVRSLQPRGCRHVNPRSVPARAVHVRPEGRWSAACGDRPVL